MESTRLKRMIGLIYLSIVVLVFLFNKAILNFSLHRLIVCFNFSLLGLTGRSLIYYAFLKKDERRPLEQNERNNCIFSYVFYAILSFAIVSLIYLISFDNFIKMNLVTFNTIAGFLFTFIGFEITEVGVHYFLNRKS
jgi:hypothetical protein